jgi:hypothetical protein
MAMKLAECPWANSFYYVTEREEISLLGKWWKLFHPLAANGVRKASIFPPPQPLRQPGKKM